VAADAIRCLPPALTVVQAAGLLGIGRSNALSLGPDRYLAYPGGARRQVNPHPYGRGAQAAQDRDKRRPIMNRSVYDRCPCTEMSGGTP
jgi:hypothetical protein